MSLWESGHSSGEVSLETLLTGQRQRGRGIPLSYHELLERVVIGGWPSLLGASEEDARDWLAGYLRQIVDVDIPSMGHHRNPNGLRRLLESLARGVGQAVKQSELMKDVAGEAGASAGVSDSTLSAYLTTLDRLMLTENSEAWRPHMRSKTRLRSAPVRYFVDPSIAPAALGIGSEELRMDPRAAGFHFEALVIRDLRIYAQPLHGRIDSWRDANGNEVDAVMSMRGGRWAAFEVKLNRRDVDQAAAALLRFADNVDPDRHSVPDALAVITSTGVAGRRADGVHVIPITAFGP